MQRHKFLKGFLSGVLVAVLILGGGIIVPQAVRNHKNAGGAVNPQSFQKAKLIESVINDEYLEAIDRDKLESFMYKGLVAGLGDPYSTYYTKEEYDKLTVETEGHYKGIGVVMQQDMKTGEVILGRCYENAPGAKAGLLPGDILTMVDGESIDGMELTEVVKKIKAAKDEITHITILRDDEELEFEIKLEVVEVPAVEYEMLADKIGYIAMYEFTEVTVPQYEKAFEALKEQGMERLIVDLRGNPGGLLSSVCGVLENILPEGLIVYTEDKNGKRNEYNCKGENPLDMPLAVLVNGNSASAAEIFAGAIQDYGIGKLVGTTTFGKGIVQKPVKLSDGSAVKLTISKYYTPKGRNIHGTGIKPDVEVKLNEELLQKVTVEKEEDNQLQKAIEVVKGM